MTSSALPLQPGEAVSYWSRGRVQYGAVLKFIGPYKNWHFHAYQIQLEMGQRRTVSTISITPFVDLTFEADGDGR